VTRWKRWYPKSWRARYGEEYGQLLEDLEAEHRLSPRDQLDIYRSGLVLHGASPDGRRRIMVLAMAVAIIGTGLGLGLGLGGGGSVASKTYVAPLLTAVPVSSARPARLTLSVKSCPVNLDGQLLGPSGVPVEDSYYWEAPPLPPSREFSSGTIDGISWRIYAPQPSSTRSSLLARLDTGGLDLDGHWYSLCELFNASLSLPGQFTGDSAIWAPTFTLVDISGRAVAYGIFPTATQLRLHEAGGPTLYPAVIESGAGPFSLFLGVLPGNACQLSTLEVSDVTLRSGWQGSETLEPSRCTSFRPLTPPSLGGGPVSRNTGTVAAVGANSIVVSSEGWPTLHVSIESGTRILLDGPNWRKGTLSEVKRCDFVYVAGTISPTTAMASAVYVVGPGPLSCSP